MKQIGRWLQRFLTAILVAVILMNGILLVKRFVYHEELPSLFGYSMVTVLSGSMEPAFSPGDSLIIRQQADYAPGEIVTFGDQGTFVTHRVMDKDGETFQTKGDANNAPDGVTINRDNIYGSVRLVIPRLGNLILFLKSSLGMLVMVVALMLLVEAPHLRKRELAG